MNDSIHKYATMATVFMPYHCSDVDFDKLFRGESWWHKPAYQDRRRSSECLPDFKYKKHNSKKGKK